MNAVSVALRGCYHVDPYDSNYVYLQVPGHILNYSLKKAVYGNCEKLKIENENENDVMNLAQNSSYHANHPGHAMRFVVLDTGNYANHDTESQVLSVRRSYWI